MVRLAEEWQLLALLYFESTIRSTAEAQPDCAPHLGKTAVIHQFDNWPAARNSDLLN